MPLGLASTEGLGRVSGTAERGGVFLWYSQIPRCPYDGSENLEPMDRPVLVRLNE